MNPLFDRLSSDFLPRFLGGVVVNFEIAGIAIALGLACGLLLAVARIYGGALEQADYAREWIEVQPAASALQKTRRVDDGRHVQPYEHGRLDHELHIAEVHVQRTQDEAQSTGKGDEQQHGWKEQEQPR